LFSLNLKQDLNKL